MLKDKIQALLKSLPQRPRSRFVPLPESAARLANELSAPELFGAGGLTDVLLKKVRNETSLDVKRNDFKLDMLSAHFFMNFKVVDEHGRQLGMGRNLGALKAELGAQARGAFQALAQLRPVIAGNVIASKAKQTTVIASEAKQSPDRHGATHLAMTKGVNAMTKGVIASEAKQTTVIASAAKQSDKHTTWSFGELPELMEISKGGQTLVGFPALVDMGDAVCI
jgi:ATP-dependent helicase HrpA